MNIRALKIVTKANVTVISDNQRNQLGILKIHPGKQLLGSVSPKQCKI